MAVNTTTLMNQAKLAARVKTDSFNEQFILLINAAMLDLGVAGVEIPEENDALVTQAVITYVLMNFGEPDSYDRLKRSYDEQKAQLSTCTGYTNWRPGDNG